MLPLKDSRSPLRKLNLRVFSWCFLVPLETDLCGSEEARGPYAVWALRAWLCLLNTSKIRQLYKQDQGPGQLPRVVTVLGTEAGQAHVGTLRESRQAGEVGGRPPRSPLPGCPDALKEALGGTNLRQFISEDSIHSGHKC